MKQLSIRQWFILAGMICLFLPILLFNLVEEVQHLVRPVSGDNWIVWPLTSAVIAWGGTVIGSSWVIHHAVVKPLSAMQQAAYQITAGNLDFSLSPSFVKEVNEVAAAFSAMSQGLQTSIVNQAALEQERRLLISAIAHDLRTPLFSLRGYLEGLEKGISSTPEKREHYFRVCREQAFVLEQRIEALFHFSRLAYLEQPSQRQDVNWGSIVQETVDRIRPSAEAKGIQLEVNASMISSSLEGDPQLLTRMLENLLDNAVRHTPPDGKVSLNWQQVLDRLCFTVVDSGPGIAQEDFLRIFQPMYRVDSSRSRVTGGAGLGLTIAQRIARVHGGNLEASNHALGGLQISGWLSCR